MNLSCDVITCGARTLRLFLTVLLGFITVTVVRFILGFWNCEHDSASVARLVVHLHERREVDGVATSTGAELDDVLSLHKRVVDRLVVAVVVDAPLARAIVEPFPHAILTLNKHTPSLYQ